MKFRVLAAKALLVAFAIVSGQAHGQQFPGSNGTLANNLFQQQYTPGGASQTTAALYPAPHWVPGNVGGHSWYTYQPLMPHEMMHQHSRNYYNYQNGPEAFYQHGCNGCQSQGGGSLNITKVRWQSGYAHMGPLPFTTNPLAKAQYAFAQRYYCIDGNCGGGRGLGSLLHRPGLLQGHGWGHSHHGYSDAGQCEGGCVQQ